MNRKAMGITIIAVVATAASVVIGARAIVGTAATLRGSTETSAASPGELERAGSEIEVLLDNLTEVHPSDDEAESGRDPMKPYVAPKPKAKPKPRPPAKPTYKVAAVFIDEDPTAIIIVNGTSVRVQVGDEVTGGRVVSIEKDGVTIRGDEGEKKYVTSP